MQIYQDIWVNGEVLRKGIRGCDAERYEPIRRLCSKYKRPFTVLDIGSCLGYFPFRLASEFNCTAVMIEATKHYINALSGPARPVTDDLISGLMRQQDCKDRLLLLNKRLTLGSIKRLSECEHFDVILALRVVHHFKEPFADVIDAMVSLGDHVFLELPTAGETTVRAKGRVRAELANHEQLLSGYSHELAGEYPIHVGPGLSPMYRVKGGGVSITRPYYDSRRKINHTVKSGFRRKVLVKKEEKDGRGNLQTKWVPGINLRTWHVLNGFFPNRRFVTNLLRKYRLPRNSPLTDIAMWNFIISGEKVTLIDHTSVNDSKGGLFPKGNPQHKLEKVARRIRRK